MAVHLVGGGWSAPSVYAPFLAEAGPRVACVLVDEGDGAQQVERWAALVRTSAEPVPVLVPLGSVLDPAALDDVTGVLVCGGLTPAYADALAPAAPAFAGRPYLGFSAGAAVAAEHAVVGGWRAGGRPVCPEDAAEDLDEVEVVRGLGLVPFAVDVHAAQWGTLGRLVAARPALGIALDEDALAVWDGSELVLHGPGGAALVRAAGDDVLVRRLEPGARVVL